MYDDSDCWRLASAGAHAHDASLPQTSNLLNDLDGASSVHTPNCNDTRYTVLALVVVSKDMKYCKLRIVWRGGAITDRAVRAELPAGRHPGKRVRVQNRRKAGQVGSRRASPAPPNHAN